MTVPENLKVVRNADEYAVWAQEVTDAILNDSWEDEEEILEMFRAESPDSYPAIPIYAYCKRAHQVWIASVYPSDFELTRTGNRDSPDSPKEEKGGK